MRLDPPAAARLPLIDAARGLAVLAMALYHFSWDLGYFGYITADVEAGGWKIFARLIAGTFLFIVGVSLVLAERGGFDLHRFLRRLAMVVSAAALITVVTWYTFRDAYIFFGILHHIAVASVLGLAFVRAPVVVTVAASTFSFLAPHVLAGPAFDSPFLVWLGLSTRLPHTNDFVPVFPWFGVVLAGIAAARLAPRLGLEKRLAGVSAPAWLLWIGRHALVVYLLHQPILFGLTDLAARVYPPDLLGFEPAYLQSCTAACTESENEPAICERTCDCLASRSQAEGLWKDLMRQTLTPEGEQRYYALVDECRAEAGDL